MKNPTNNPVGQTSKYLLPDRRAHSSLIIKRNKRISILLLAEGLKEGGQALKDALTWAKRSKELLPGAASFTDLIKTPEQKLSKQLRHNEIHHLAFPQSFYNSQRLSIPAPG